MCNEDALAAQCRKLRNLAFEPAGRRFIHYELGWNYRMTNLQAALGLAQLEKLEEHLVKKREIGHAYQAGLKEVKGFQLPLAATDYADNIYWVFGLVADSMALQEAMVKKLNDAQIGTRPFFWCMHEQPVFQKIGLFINEQYPVAEKLARNGFYIPSGLGLSFNEIDIVIEAFKKEI
jgi:perosamine synthetase